MSSSLCTPGPDARAVLWLLEAFIICTSFPDLGMERSPGKQTETEPDTQEVHWECPGSLGVKGAAQAEGEAEQ